MGTFLDFNVASPAELVTTDAGRRGMRSGLAVERQRRWKPLAQRVACLKYDVGRAKSPSCLLHDFPPSNALRLAAGINNKSISTSESEARMHRFLNETFRKRNDWKRIVVERFHEACEVELDRQMRGASQRLAVQLISRRVISNLRIEGKKYCWLNNLTHRWGTMPKYDCDVELSVGGLSWVNHGRPRTLIYNHEIECSGRHIDLCLFGCEPKNLPDEPQNCARECLAAGVMNGAIRPTGADERWRIARTALVRNKSAFAKHDAQPKMFFVGAAIATKMATEIWTMLKKGDLDNAANLTDDNQLAAVTRWLCSL